MFTLMLDHDLVIYCIGGLLKLIPSSGRPAGEFVKLLLIQRQIPEKIFDLTLLLREIGGHLWSREERKQVHL